MGIVIALLVWIIAEDARLLPRSEFPSLSATASAFVAQFRSAPFASALAVTLSTWAVGLAIALAISLFIGSFLGSNARAFRSTWLIVEFLKPIPPVALVPLALLLYGTSFWMPTGLVIFGTVWPLLVHVIAGIRGVDPVALDSSRAYRLSRRHTLRYLILPSVLPSLMTGLRIAGSLGLAIAVTAELIGGSTGLGNFVALDESASKYAPMYAVIISTGLIGIAINSLFKFLSRKIVPWHHERFGASL